MLDTSRAGVLGLTTALRLARNGYKHITVVAKHMPGDRSPEYASIWAGALWVPESPEGSELAKWELQSWQELSKLAKDTPEAGVWFRGKPRRRFVPVWLLLNLADQTRYYRNKDRTPGQLEDWFAGVVSDVRHTGFGAPRY